MLTLSPEACDYAIDNGGTLFLEYIVVGDCCIPYQPEPSVRMGKPHNPEHYVCENTDGLTLFVTGLSPGFPWSRS